MGAESHMGSIALVRRLWPAQIGNQCLLMLAAGVMFALIAPPTPSG
jgi:Flp pilus assembly protein TadG